MSASALPYRHNVGIALFNAEGRVLIARRIGDDGPEIIRPGHAWQMPQGGIDPDEDPEAAARRELWEETNVTTARVLGCTNAWMHYDFPPYAGPPHRLCAFQGQQQIWYAMRFLGDDSEIDVTRTHNGAEPEFDAWRWEHLDAVSDLVVPFKRDIYRSVAAAFRRFAQGDA
ncbi:MAG: hydrolase [Microvirga sp.]|nr:hydrolase [Microvirga sp.]